MVEKRVTDGVRIAELLASEVEGRADGPLGGLSVTDAVPDVEPTANGARAYDVSRADDGADRCVATVNVHEDRIHFVVRTAQERAHEAATSAGLRTRPKATTPPQTLIFVESGVEVKRAAEVLAAVGRALDE